jgi:2-methylisocitrate lyase-like PEP mutase family enzyme
VQAAGFEMSFLSGFAAAATRGFPDTGLLSYAEVLDQGRAVAAAVDIPVFCDGDTGYGNAANCRRTVEGFAQAGLAGVMIEDQKSPKSCGHVRAKAVVGRDEAVARIRAACEARDAAAARLGQPEGIVVVARTDARQAASLEEALWRVGAFAEAGADVLFVDALETEAEMRAFASEAQAQGLPALANMLEGGGKTPILTPAQLEDAGFSVAAYPLSLLGVSVRAMQRALQDLRQGRVPRDAVPFPELQKTLGFPEYFEEVEYFEAYGRGFVAREQQKPGREPETEGRKEVERDLEAEVPLRGGGGGPESPPGPEIVVPEVLGRDGPEGDGGDGAEGGGGEPRSLVGVERIRFIVSNLRTGADEVNVCVPSATLGVGLKSIRALLEELNLAKAMGEVETAVEAGTVLDFTAGDYRVQIIEG